MVRVDIQGDGDGVPGFIFSPVALLRFLRFPYRLCFVHSNRVCFTGAYIFQKQPRFVLGVTTGCVHCRVLVRTSLFYFGIPLGTSAEKNKPCFLRRYCFLIEFSLGALSRKTRLPARVSSTLPMLVFVFRTMTEQNCRPDVM